ncbi:MAG TPA: hypothetical protein VMT20_25705 [Terriglobia bacterium]|nr:hypothetical protein [Terriglobia bacterium]
MKGLLREFGAHWFPVELDTNKVCRREETGIRAPDSFVDKELLSTFFSVQSKAYADANKIIPPSGDFFNLDVVIDWLATNKESLVRHNRELDGALIRKISEYRDEVRRDPSWLDQSFPELEVFRKDMPATFAYVNLIRNMVRDRDISRRKAMAWISLMQW